MSNKMHSTSEMGAPLKENKIATLIPKFCFYGQFAAVFLLILFHFFSPNCALADKNDLFVLKSQETKPQDMTKLADKGSH